MGIVYYNLYRAPYEYLVDMDKLKNLDFFKSGRRGNRFGVDTRSIVNMGKFYKFDLCWEEEREYTIAGDNEFKHLKVNAVESKNIILVGRYILVQTTNDKDKEKKLRDFVMQHFSDEKGVPISVKFDEKLLDYIMKRAEKLRKVVYEQKMAGRAEKVKLLSTSTDLRSTEDFEIYRDREKKEVRVIYGKKENMWVSAKEGDPGLMGISTVLRDKRDGLKMLYEFIENLIEPNVDKVYQLKL